MRKLGRKALSALLALALFVSVLPLGAVPVRAADETFVTTGGLTVTGERSGYSYNEQTHVLTVNAGADLTISVTTETDSIVAAGNANLTLAGVNITHTDGSNEPAYNYATPDNVAGTCALAVGSGATLNLTLSGENTLQSGTGCAGISVESGADLVVDGTGRLAVTGGHSAAGIGGGAWNNAGDITISNGTVIATGGADGAASGGGHANDKADDSSHPYGSYESIAINGGHVTATSGGNAAGIGTGCWAQSGGAITIKDAVIQATSTASVNGDCAAIGRGYATTSGCQIAISDSVVTVSNNNKGAAIASGTTEETGVTLNCIVFSETVGTV